MTSREERHARERARRLKRQRTAAKATQMRGHQPFDPPRPGEDIDTAFIPGITVDTPAAIEKMQKETHDGLIEMLGRRRRSGIRWRRVDGPAECERILRLMYEHDPVKWSAVEEHYLPFIERYGDASVMIVAECEAVSQR